MALAMESSSSWLVPKKLWEYYPNTLELYSRTDTRMAENKLSKKTTF